MQQDDSWVPGWTAKKLTDHNMVESIATIAANVIEITRKKGRSNISVYTTSRKKLSRANYVSIVESHPGLSFVANLTNESVITGGAIAEAAGQGIPIGAMGDLFRIIGMQDVSTYVNPRVVFVTRGLRQHSRVLEVTRLDNRRYQIARRDLPEVTILEFDDYEITADVLRSRIEMFGAFDAFLASNPNARRTGSASAVAESTRRPIYMWGELMGHSTVDGHRKDSFGDTSTG